MPSASTSVAVGARWALGRRVRRPEVSCGPRPDVRTRAGSGPAASQRPFRAHTLHLVAKGPRPGGGQLRPRPHEFSVAPRTRVGGPSPAGLGRFPARCSEASTPEDGPARPSVLQLRTLLRLLMSQPRGTSCDKSAPAGKPVGGCRAPSEGEEPLSHSVFLPRVLFRSRRLLAPHTSSE